MPLFALFTPLLAGLGFGGMGPIAAFFAAWWQSILGVNMLFGAFQSAAMGGYGVPFVNALFGGQQSKMDDKAAKAAFEYVKKTFGFLVEGLQHVNWPDLPEQVKEQIRNKPNMTIFALLTLLVAVVPGLVATPLLNALGLSGLGPIAGSAAAWFQSTYGANALFSTLQSAAMGGYGAATVHGVVSGIFAAAGASGTWLGWNRTTSA
ncbi:hypothetical protein EJ03DRAFT_382625 [Teratosphaeria nubilosa]|uniref:Uncharacterized protein n=1 Tax=Teratosphaeria nubilosa TaxID=161662 RepID=A0A6G1L9F3_9PEZI|nr:hypothetical protein EJ03DRAFT_382625 [Teratosphaeria nubilosa]